MSIKVTTTRKHAPRNWDELSDGRNKDYHYPVADGIFLLIEMLPKEAMFYQQDYAGQTVIHQYYPETGLVRGIGKYLSPIIISDTEKIEKGDNWFDLEENEIWKYGPNVDLNTVNLQPKRFKKILALPEHFSQKHVNDILNNTIINESKVGVECELMMFKGGEPDPSGYYVKLNYHKNINFHKIEERSIPLSEVKAILHNFNQTIISQVLEDNEMAVIVSSDVDKWFKENVV